VTDGWAPATSWQWDRANANLFFPLKKRKEKIKPRKKKEKDPQIPTHSCQLVAASKGEVSDLQRHRLSVLY